MTGNQRESFRVEGGPFLQAELFHEGRVRPCGLENLSAGGASLTTELSMEPGAQCTLGVRLREEDVPASGVSYVSFLMEVLERTQATESDESRPFHYRLRNTTALGSADHESATKLVFEVQRRALAARSGAAQASPMASDEQRREELRVEQRPRFSKGSTRPGPTDRR